MIIHTIEARTHGRYLVEPPERAGVPLLVGFHGYAETAEAMLTHLRSLSDGRGWGLVSVQALHRFYIRGQQVAGSWMTRQDRELEIADNTAYVWSVVEAVRREYPGAQPLVFVGFSQGAAMAYRAAAAGACGGVVVLAGDVPPDVAPRAATLPPILIGRGVDDKWYTSEKANADGRVLDESGTRYREHVFAAGHEWHPSFVTAAREFIGELT